MNYSRLALAALGGTVASFAFGFLVLWLVPALSMKATSTRPYSDLRRK
jgi:high-affinity Fe2+/Pb2+ permease